MLKTLLKFMARAFFPALLFLVAAPAFAWSTDIPDVTRFEGEAFFSVGSGIGGFHHGKKKFEPGSMGIKLRYNIQATPISAGMFLRLDVNQWYFPSTAYSGCPDSRQGNRTFGIGAIGEYNFRQGKAVNPFVDLGIGFATNDIISSDVFPVEEKTLPIVIPEIGVELFYFLRIQAHASFFRKGFNNCGIGAGLVIGGWKKKKNSPQKTQ